MYVAEIVCNHCRRKSRNDISICITKSRKTCRKCGHEEEDNLAREFCSPDCAIKFLKRYRSHKCREHLHFQFSESEISAFVKDFGSMKTAVNCLICNKPFMAEVKRGKKGCLKKVLRDFRKS